MSLRHLEVQLSRGSLNLKLRVIAVSQPLTISTASRAKREGRSWLRSSGPEAPAVAGASAPAAAEPALLQLARLLGRQAARQWLRASGADDAAHPQ
jgi:hypothetical protein